MKNKTLRLLPFRQEEGALNMALDEGLLLKGQGALRFYSWGAPCLSLGYFQKSSEINIGYLQEEGIDLVRRLTGGKAVYHHRELTYCLILTASDLPAAVGDSCRLISDCLSAGLKTLGLKPQIVTRPPRTALRANCFQAPGWFEICIKGAKLIGSAQMRKNGMVMQQGSLLIARDPEKSAPCFTDGSSTGKGATSLEELLPEVPSLIELSRIFQEAFVKHLKLPAAPAQWQADEVKAATNLAREKYRNRDWNLRR